jgi:hypothetical protein
MPGGEDIARAETLLKVMPEPEPSEPVGVLQHNEDAAEPNEGVRPFVKDTI